MAIGLALLVACAAGCAEPAPASFGSERVLIEYAVYFTAAPRQDPRAVLERAIARRDLGLPIVAWEHAPHEGQFVVVHEIADPVTDMPLPTVEALQLFGRGLGPEQVSAVQKPHSAITFGFGHPGRTAARNLALANELVLEVAESSDGLIWDADSRMLLTPAAWRESRLESDATPTVAKHIAIHIYSVGETKRAVTLGMGKLALPDLVVEDFPPSSSPHMNLLLVAVAQSLSEGARPRADGSFEVEFDHLRDDEVRAQLETQFSNATRKAELTLRTVQAQAGDAENTLLAIGFSRYPGPDLYARQGAMKSAVFGWSDAIKTVDHTSELEAASARAKAKLPELRARLESGLEPGEYLQVKAPFAIPGGGREWMWVEVLRWNGDEIDGVLSNEPFQIPELHAGQAVRVSEADVFDYLHVHADGTTRGNETSAIIERMQAPVERAGAPPGD